MCESSVISWKHTSFFQDCTVGSGPKPHFELILIDKSSLSVTVFSAFITQTILSIKSFPASITIFFFFFSYFHNVTSSWQFPSTSRHRNLHENTKGGTPGFCLQLSPHFFCLSACDCRRWLIPVSAVIFAHSTHTGMITAVHQVWSRPHCAEVSQCLGLSGNDRGRGRSYRVSEWNRVSLSSPVLGGADKHIHFTWSLFWVISSFCQS